VALLRWDKPSGRLILLIPAGWSLWLSPAAPPSAGLVILIVAGGLAVSGAGCIANDLWDRHIDRRVARTRSRPLASGALRPSTAVALLALMLAVAVAVVLALPAASRGLVIGLALACLPLVLLYPSAKRWSPLPQLVLALCWGFAVLIPWAAATAGLAASPALVGCWLATVLWTFGFDTVYAMPDRHDDARIGVRSSARTLGRHAPLAVTVCYGAAALLLGWAALGAGVGWPFWPLWALATAGLLREGHRLEGGDGPAGRYARHFRDQVRLGALLLLALLLGRSL
jgi:4-hydroxybenzoate polyprenyltransferase